MVTTEAFLSSIFRLREGIWIAEMVQDSCSATCTHLMAFLNLTYRPLCNMEHEKTEGAVHNETTSFN